MLILKPFKGDITCGLRPHGIMRKVSTRYSEKMEEKEKINEENGKIKEVRLKKRVSQERKWRNRGSEAKKRETVNIQNIGNSGYR